jgi:hypothetical protein
MFPVCSTTYRKRTLRGRSRQGFVTRQLSEPSTSKCQVFVAPRVTLKGAFWFPTYEGGLSGELLVELLKKLMYRRKKPLHLVVDGLPAHKRKVV